MVGSTSDTQWLSADIIRIGPDGYSPDGYSQLRILVDSNFTGTSRAARVQLDGYYGRQVYFITQEAISPTLEGVNTSFWMDGGSIVLRAGHSNGVKWRLVSSVPWIAITGDSSGEGNEIETNFTVMPSDDGRERTGSITLQGFKSLNDSWVSLKSISIRQDGWLSYAGEKISVSSPVTIKYPKGDLSEFWVDGKSVAVSSDGGSYVWQPLTKGDHDVKCIYGSSEWSSTLIVSALQTFEDSVPNPPMAKDNNISIYPLTDHFDVGGGGLAISTSGSGTWTAVASEPWITLNSTSGTAGKPLAFRVSANTNVEERTAYIYVSGHVYTATQTGIGATVDKSNETFEYNGGFGTVNVTAQNRVVWQARPNVDWISVSPTSGSGEGSIEYQVAPFDEVSTRQGTMTVAGNTVTVFQYGRRMKLATYEEKRDWYTHVIPITVDALAITEWSVTPNASWISVVDGGNGKGGDLVSIAISENSSYKERVGTVTIGTEIFTVTQDGRTELEISIDPVESEASVNGANAFLSVYATPDLPWTVTSDSSWVTIYDKFKNGEGNGNIVYIVTPNSTLYDRTAIVSVIPEKASGMPTRKHTVRQPAAESAISLNGYEFEVAGESCSVEVSVADIVEWKIDENLDWITINGSTSRMGSGTVVIQAAANDTVNPRSGAITIARKTFTVTQKARGVEVEYDEKLFNARGGSSSVSIHPDGNVAWTVEVSDDWIIVWGDESGTGDAEIEYIVAAWNDEGSSRTGWIKIGDKKIYITQRAYDLSISPNGKKVTRNNGAGEIGVSASIGDVWNAIVTEPWITIVDGYDSGTGSGTVRFIYTENSTGKTRTGKIIVAGEVYTLEQAARMMVNITATAGRGGKVSGGGLYDLGSEVTITAIPDDGYKFSYWTGDVSTMQNPIKVTVDVAKSVTAVFEPLPIAFESVTSGSDGVRLSWNNLAWATTYRIYRGVTSVPSSATVLAEIVNTGNCTYLDESGVVGTTYWYWIEAEGAEDSVMSDPMTGMKQKPIVISSITYQNLRGATHANPDSYREGTVVSFVSPSKVSDYTFVGWTPSQITADMTGDIVVTANWEWAPQDAVVDASVTGWKPVTVKADWVKTELEQKFGAGKKESFITKFGDNLTSAMTKKTGKRDSAGNELFVWHDYVAGTDPTDINSTFMAKIDIQDGKPVISWEPNLNSAGEERVYTVHGKEKLSDIWHSPIAALDHFFKVDVAMPREGTVTFNVGGGSSVSPVSIRVGQPIGELPTPTRDGYKFLGWFTAAEGGVAITPETVVTADMMIYARWELFDIHEKVQLWEGSPYWATTNIGAENPEDYGYYFWWGDTVGYKRENEKWVASDGSSSNFSFSSLNTPTYKNVATLQSEGWITPDGVLAPEHDAAHVHWGGDWRMPTTQELDDLNSKCDWTWTTMNGVDGYVVRGRGEYASNSIFLPYVGGGYGTSLGNAGAGGGYWSSVPDSGYKRAWDLYFDSGTHNTYDNSYRYNGQSVRPLQGFTK